MTATTASRVEVSERSSERLLTPAFIRLALADLAYFTAAGIAIYTLPLYVTGPVGSDHAGAGLAFGAFAVSALVLRPYAGRLADVRGRRPLLVGGALLCAAAMFLTAFTQALPLVVGLRLLLGVAEAAFFVASFAALADLAPPSRMGEALSYNSLGLYVGFALGPPLGEVLVTSLSYSAAWYGAAVLALVAAKIVHGLGETRTPRAAGEGSPAALIHRKAIAPGIGFFTSIVAMGAFLAFASLQAEAVGLESTSLPLFVYGSVVVIGRIVFARVPDRLPSLPLGAGALGLIAVGLAVTAAWRTPAGMLVGTAVLALGVTFSTPAFFAAMFATAGPSERGAASATASAFLDLGLGGGPILIGFAAATIGVPSAFLVAATVAVAGSIWTLSLRRSSTVGGASAAV